MSVAEHVGRESVIEALGQKWRVSRWTRAVWGDFLAWAKTKIPDPVEVALKHLDKFPPHLQDAMVRHALDRSSQYLAINSPEVDRLLGSIEGMTYLLYLLLRQHQSAVTEDQAIEICLELGQKEIEKATAKAAGRVEGAPGNSPAPVGRVCRSSRGASTGTRSTGVSAKPITSPPSRSTA